MMAKFEFIEVGNPKDFIKPDGTFYNDGCLPNIPTRGTAKSAGYDFYMPYDLDIEPGQTALVFTNIKCYLEDNKVLKIFPRSSMAKKGLVMANVVGIVDADYYSNQDNDGNIGLLLKNTSNVTFKLDKYDRVAQGIIESYYTCSDDLSDAKRKGGFGSTDL
jgi:dUTP pyrophosphatase